jgi:hypothetical protein
MACGLSDHVWSLEEIVMMANNYLPKPSEAQPMQEDSLGMNNGSYWHGYLVARHHVFLVMGIVLMAATLISAITGTTLVKYQGIVSRAEDPEAFREGIITYCVLGLVCLALYLYTSN